MPHTQINTQSIFYFYKIWTGKEEEIDGYWVGEVIDTRGSVNIGVTRGRRGNRIDEGEPIK